MGGRLYKNFRLFKSELIVLGVMQAIVSAVIIVAAAISKEPEGIAGISIVVYFYMFILSNFFNSGLFAPDEKRTVSSFILSAPGGMKAHIQSKYYSILIINLLILFCCLITDTIVCAVANTTLCSVAGYCVIFLEINLILESVAIPFIIRCGSNHGLGIMVLVIVAIVILVDIYALFGDISMFLVDDLEGAIMEFITSGNAVLVISLIPFVGVLAYWISYRISLVVFRKGVDNYEQ